MRIDSIWFSRPFWNLTMMLVMNSSMRATGWMHGWRLWSSSEPIGPWTSGCILDNCLFGRCVWPDATQGNKPMEPSVEVADLLRFHETKLTSVLPSLCLFTRTLCGEGKHLPTNCSLAVGLHFWVAVMVAMTCQDIWVTVVKPLDLWWEGNEKTKWNPKCGSDLVTNWKALRHLG